MDPKHHAQLVEAKTLLEHPGLAVKVTNLVGKPLEKGFEVLPANWRQRIGDATQNALMVAMKAAILTMRGTSEDAYPRWHKLAAALSGAAGGAFGLPALIIELPVSTTIMCRSIADIARANGESLDSVPGRLACLEVFALGGKSRADDAADTGYFAVRAALASAVSEAAEYLASHTLADAGAPAMVRLVALIAARFEIQVSEKAAAQAVPIIGAASGALINLLFIDHFQNMSRGHFIVRRLERHYGKDEVRRAYEEI